VIGHETNSSEAKMGFSAFASAEVKRVEKPLIE